MADLLDLHGRVVIVGAGIAGLMAALELAPQPVVLVSRDGLGRESSSAWAQGGIAASVGSDDSAALHLSDTLMAGAGHCDATVAEAILSESSHAIAALEQYGVRFDRTACGGYAFGREAAHSRRRILHSDGDGSGAAMTAALVTAAFACPSITSLTGVEVRRLIMQDDRIAGVLLQRGRQVEVLRTERVVLATGGIGGLYDATTNPVGNFGQGIAMAARAGAALADMEFVQFHPTALDTPRRPLALISEAVRGEGAVLVDQKRQRVMAGTPGADLAPRDVVARAIHTITSDGGKVYLDASQALGARFASRFPKIHQLCRAANIDPAAHPIPVRPAAHYHMGGIATDSRARSSLDGLWAVGECASTGLHGANRLASNSLLEAVVMARRAAKDISGRPTHSPGGVAKVPPVALPAADPETVRPIVSAALGVARDGTGLRAAMAALLPLARGSDPSADPAIVALSIAVFAALREESRGAHFRSDFPVAMSGSTRRRLCLDDIRASAHTLLAQPMLRSA
ncbi:L-aspartate oxidase [Tropicimonas marinistellae]|uniref:L-aspartate oxidase n=1 Tax=Tropicimonas marinistellae TaxID=1739787 RepID=UPI00082A20DB|nr:L-aspartate oxidase [Tropicimonas marinistellae]